MGTEFLITKNNAESTLKGAVTVAATTWVVNDGSVFPSTYPYNLSCNDEIVQVSNRSTNDLTITRAQEGTTAAVHSNGAHVYLNITSKHISDLNTAVNTMEGTFSDGEVHLTPKASSSGPEGTIFYNSDDNAVYVGTE